MGARLRTILELDHDRLSAVQVSGSGTAIRLIASVIALRPTDVDVGDAQAMGAWIARTLGEAGFKPARATLSLSRRDIVLKRLSLPGADELGRAELASMVQLQMGRQMTVALEGTSFDYLVLHNPRDEGAAVLAGAMPGDRLAWCKAMAKSAGLRLERITLRAFGIAALVSASQLEGDSAGLIIASSPGSVEFVIVQLGQILFARSADIPRPDPDATPEQLARLIERVAVEAKRTWMSYRVSQNAAEIDTVLVLGADPFATQVAESCSEALELSSRSVDPIGDENPASAALLPLVGLASAEASGVLNFVDPRKAPDVAASRRQLAMLVMLILIIVGGGAWVLGSGRLDRLKGELAREQDRRAELSAQYGRLYTEQARLAHLDQWLSSRTDWLAHLRWISDHLPDPKEGQLDSIRGSVAYAPSFVPDGKGPISGTWPVQRSIALTIKSTARVSGLLAKVREQLLSEGLYAVDTIGPDTVGSINLELRTNRDPSDEPKPIQPDPAQPEPESSP